MAVKFTKTDDLDKMFEEFAKLPDLKSSQVDAYRYHQDFGLYIGTPFPM